MNSSLKLQIPITPFDNLLAMKQIELAYDTLLLRKVSDSKGLAEKEITHHLTKDGLPRPRIVR
jgi:agmatinase